MEFLHSEATDFNTDLCLSLANQMSIKKVELGSNFVCSPLSLRLVISLVASGSTGRTLEQLLTFLGSKSIGELNHLSSQIVALALKAGEGEETGETHSGGRSPEVLFANGVWVDQSFGLKPSFERLVKDVFKAKAEEFDIANKPEEVRHSVNTWVGKETRELIKEILPSGSVDGETALILANALYFKGAWNQKFDASKTQHRDFQFLNGESVRVPFMTGVQYQRYLYGSFHGYRVLQLPYQSGNNDTRQFSMYFFLPDKTDGLLDLIKMLSSKPGFFNQQFLLRREKLTDFWIPRFKFSAEFEASETMKEMGLDLPFHSRGELGEMVTSNGNKLHVSKVFHKSCIEVNEEGTEAAASTALLIRKCCARFPVPRFVADHPFMFMIREEKSGTVFFTGAVLNPLLN